MPFLKLNWIKLFTILSLVAVVFAFTTAEIEIFQLQKEIEKKYGETINFYKLLKLPKGTKSTSKEISKNLRKLSKKYHPDKNRKYKTLYSRLTLATQILSDDSTRKTYDYYIKNGFPNYDFSKGGFFFTRVQPKTWFILGFIFLVSSGMHYVLLKIQYNANVRRIDSFIEQCKEQDTSNGLGESKISFKQSEQDEGKDLLIKYGSVYLIEKDGSESLISSDTVLEPTVTDTILFKAPNWIWSITLGKVFGKKDDVNESMKLGTKDSKKQK